MGYFKKNTDIMSGSGEWDESEHPRDSDGKFTANGASTYPQNTKYDDIIKMDKERSLTKEVNNDNIKFIEPTSNDFYNSISIAKSLDKNNGWAVDIHSKSEYNNMKRKLTENGGAGIAVESNGNIVSVFNAKTSGYKGIVGTLLKEAVAMGGDRLDAYGKGLFKIYTDNGFEPVSWVEWNDEYAPPDWNESKGRQPIVFYKYVGVGNVKIKDYSIFMSNVEKSIDYDTAQQIRNKEIK